MIRTIAIVLIIAWLFGAILRIGGGFVHLLLLAALAVFVYDFVVGRRTV